METGIVSKSAQKHLNRSTVRPGKHDEIKGLDQFDKIIEINQSPIGRTPRSNPGTYTGLFSFIRELFSKTGVARMSQNQVGNLETVRK